MERIKDRVTVIDKVYHQPYGHNPKSIECKFSRELQIVEQLYERRLQITEEWQALDCGWLKGKVGMLIIHNDEGHFLVTNPTFEERKAVAKKTVEISYQQCSFCLLVPPSESLRVRPSNADELTLRCQSGVAEITLYLIPK